VPRLGSAGDAATGRSSLVARSTVIAAIWRTYGEAYRGLPREIWMLSAVYFVSRSGKMVQTFLILYLTEVLGYGLGTAGQVLAVYGFGYLVGTFVGGWLCDRIGPLRIQFLSLALSGLGFLVLEHLRTLPAIMSTTFFIAVAAEAFCPANLSALAVFSPPQLQARAVALNRMALSLGLATGASVGGWLAMRDYALLFRVEGAACLAAAALLGLLFRSRVAKVRPASEPAPSGVEVNPLRDGAFLAFLGLIFLTMLIILQAWSTYPIYLTQVYGMTKSHYGLLMTLNGLLMLLFEMVITHSTARFQPLTVMGVGTFLLGLGFAILPLGSTWTVAVASVLIWTTGDMLGTPAAGGWVARRAGTLHRGKYMGLYTMTWGLGWIVAPAAGAFLYQASGPESLWLTAGMLGGLVWAGFELLRVRESRTRTLREA
jgi:predicted MFS family arabinose efflux permease